MPDESDRPIELQLRDYANRRRNEAGKDAFALHPVTRNALQVEVERTFGRRARFGGTRPGWLATWWPRLAWAGGGLAVLAVLAISLVPRGGDVGVGDLAKNEVAGPRRADGPVAEGGGKSAAAVDLELRDKDASEALVADRTTSQRQEFQFNRTQLKPVQTDNLRRAMPTTTGPAPRPAPTRAVASSEISEPATAAAPMAPQPAATMLAQKPAPAPLQGSFQVVIVDDQISLVDGDQSSYSGRLEAVDPSTVGGTGPARTLTFEERYHSFVQNGVVQQVPVAARFILTGTNRSTRLPVQVVGLMVTRTQAVPVQAQGGATTAKGAPPASVYLQINATATVNGSAPVAIDARTQLQ